MMFLSPIRYIMVKILPSQDARAMVLRACPRGETPVWIWRSSHFSGTSITFQSSADYLLGNKISCLSWRRQLCDLSRRKLDVIEFYTFYLSLVDYGDFQGNSGPVRANFQVSILDASGEPSKKSAADDKPTAEFIRLGNWSGQLVLTLLTSQFKELDGQLAKIPQGGPRWDDTLYPFSPEECSLQRQFCKGFWKVVQRLNLGRDVTISTGKTKFQAHTLILKARSSVFAAMFNTNMIENETKTLVISDFDDVVVKGMLEYLYTKQLIVWLSERRSSSKLLKRTKVDLTAFQATHSSSFIKMKVPSARGDLADLFLAQLFIEAGHFDGRGILFRLRVVSGLWKRATLPASTRASESKFSKYPCSNAMDDQSWKAKRHLENLKIPDVCGAAQNLFHNNPEKFDEMVLLSPIRYIMGKIPSKQKCSSYGPESVSSVGETSATCHLSRRKLDVIEFYSFYLSLADYGDFEGDPGPVRANYQVSILDAGGQPVKKSAEDKSTAEFKSSGTLSDLLVLTSQFKELAGQLAENTLKIQCKLAIFSEMKHKVSPGGMTHYTPSAELRNASFRDNFARDFGKLFRDSIGADVTISTGNTKFQAHTPPFKTLVISDFDDVVVKGMLEYLYTGKTDCMDERAPELLQIAEKYDLADLKEDCGYALAESLNKDNAPMIWLLANTHNVPFLIQRTQDFIYLNKVDLTAFQAIHSSSFIKMKVHSGRGDLADLFLAQLFIEAGHVMNNVLSIF
ncbi:Protein roadkill [Orchesella cincta]|uniref:Protein roadkill n=1 Tax=Orchesella cincta TaxID=48709 RepID=A0A1D2M467_ORCCI|nr:Protein roadkill [Orchesella cincta]